MLIGLVSGTLALSSISSSSIYLACPPLPQPPCTLILLVFLYLTTFLYILFSWILMPRFHCRVWFVSRFQVSWGDTKWWSENSRNAEWSIMWRGFPKLQWKKTKRRKVPGTKSEPSWVGPGRTTQWKYRISNECSAALSLVWPEIHFCIFPLVTISPYFYHMCLFFKSCRSLKWHQNFGECVYNLFIIIIIYYLN